MDYKTVADIMEEIENLPIKNDSILFIEGRAPIQAEYYNVLNQAVNNHRTKIGIDYPIVHIPFGEDYKISIIDEAELKSRYRSLEKQHNLIEKREGFIQEEMINNASQFEITDKTVIAISGDITMEDLANIKHKIEATTGSQPPIIMTGEGELTHINIEENTLLVLKSEYPWCGDVAMGQRLRDVFKSTIGHNVPILNLTGDDDLNQLGSEELTELRDKINILLEEVPA